MAEKKKNKKNNNNGNNANNGSSNGGNSNNSNGSNSNNGFLYTPQEFMDKPEIQEIVHVISKTLFTAINENTTTLDETVKAPAERELARQNVAADAFQAFQDQFRQTLLQSLMPQTPESDNRDGGDKVAAAASSAVFGNSNKSDTKATKGTKAKEETNAINLLELRAQKPNLKDNILKQISEGNDNYMCADTLSTIYGVKVPEEYVQQIFQEYQERHLPQRLKRKLKGFYPLVIIKTFNRTIKDKAGKLKECAVYVVQGVNDSGYGEIIHLQVGAAPENENEWLSIFSELKRRGLQDVFFISFNGECDLEAGLKDIYPNAIVLPCMLSLVRNGSKLAKTKDRKDFGADAKLLYQAQDLNEVEAAYKTFNDKWQDKAPDAVRFWDRHFAEHVRPLYQYPLSVRNIVSTNSSINGTINSLRTALRNDDEHFSREALLALLLLRTERSLSFHWKHQQIADWPEIRHALFAHANHAQIMAKYCVDGK